MLKSALERGSLTSSRLFGSEVVAGCMILAAVGSASGQDKAAEGFPSKPLRVLSCGMQEARTIYCRVPQQVRQSVAISRPNTQRPDGVAVITVFERNELASAGVQHGGL